MISKMLRCCALIFFVSTAFFSCSSGQASFGTPENGINMPYRQERGVPVEYELTVESLQVSEVQDSTSQTAQRLTSWIIQNIQNKDDNRIVVSYLFSDHAVTIQGDYPFSFNTDNLKNKTMNISVSDRGVDPAITNVDNFNEKLDYNLESISQLFFLSYPKTLSRSTVHGLRFVLCPLRCRK